jgi:hypothetical protein
MGWEADMALCLKNMWMVEIIPIASKGWSLSAQHHILSLAIAALTLSASAAPASAQSGENELTVPLSTDECPSDGDLVLACFDDGNPSNFRCNLFGVASETGDTLPLTFCSARSVLTDPELWPEEGAIEENVAVLGSSFGYIRALLLENENFPVHAFTATFSNDVESVLISPADDDGTVTQCTTAPKIQMPTDVNQRDAFCAAIEAALPISGASRGAVRFAAEYDYEQSPGASNFGTNRLITLWACPELDARCVKGSPAQFDDVAGGGAVLDDIYDRIGLTDPSNTWCRICR